MPADSALSLESISVLLVWTAIAVYALAFITYVVDLARRSAVLPQRQREVAPALVNAGGAASALDQLRAQEREAETNLTAAPSARPRLLWARIATSLTWLAFLFHLGGAITRGIVAGHVPWSNMYEFALTGTLLIVAVYLGTLFRYDLRFLGALITGMVVLLLGGVAVGAYTQVVPLADPLKSVWLVIHVFVASLATALFAIAFGLAVLQLLQARREQRAFAAVETGASVSTRLGFLRTLPSAEALEALSYRFAIMGFVFWTFTLIAGSIWANDAWGRYWGFDTKEVWTFVIWVLYAGYIHARATRGWRGTRSAWLSIIGFSAVIFNFTIVNVFFKGLHAYSGLS